jgi:hypothetical protein
MSYSNLAALNNNAAAKRAALKKTPYVPWNAEETLEPDFLSRIPNIGNAEPKGWKLHGDYPLIVALEVIERFIGVSDATWGFAEKIGGRLAVYRPLPEAHEPDKSEVR